MPVQIVQRRFRNYSRPQEVIGKWLDRDDVNNFWWPWKSGGGARLPEEENGKLIKVFEAYCVLKQI